MVMSNNEDYLRQQLEWVKYRMEALDEIEAKLKEMRELAERARGNDLTQAEAREVNARLQELEKEVKTLDAGSMVFWMDCQ